MAGEDREKQKRRGRLLGKATLELEGPLRAPQRSWQSPPRGNNLLQH